MTLRQQQTIAALRKQLRQEWATHVERERRLVSELEATRQRAKAENGRLRRKNDHLIAELSRAYIAVYGGVARLGAIRERALGRGESSD